MIDLFRPGLLGFLELGLGLFLVAAYIELLRATWVVYGRESPGGPDQELQERGNGAAT